MDTVSRRQFLQGSAAALGLVMMMHPGLVLADARTENRLVVVIMRGAMDGLAAVAPYGDPAYEGLRGDLALTQDALLKMDSTFALHKSLAPFYDMYTAQEFAAVHAAASPYRERSHFDAQNVLELGSDKPNDLPDGWLNRLVGAINAHDTKLALAIAETVPLILRGPAPVGSWAPAVLPEANADFMTRLERMYGRDARFQTALQEALDLQQRSTDVVSPDQAGMTGKKKNGAAFAQMAGVAGKWLAQPDGPRIATLEIGGWDTHVAQGTEAGRLAQNFMQLSDGIAALKSSIGAAWSRTVVVMVTEFGRTARPNGNKGTDHGTASVVMLAGGMVRGGKVYGDWPGLQESQLYQNRDLMPATDVRSVMKGVLAGLYNIPPQTLDTVIYPGSAGVRPMIGLVRSV